MRDWRRSLVDAGTGEPITTESLRYGFRTVILGIPCDAKWRTPAGLELVGPRYFGHDIDYVPVETRFGPSHDGATKRAGA